MTTTGNDLTMALWDLAAEAIRRRLSADRFLGREPGRVEVETTAKPDATAVEVRVIVSDRAATRMGRMLVPARTWTFDLPVGRREEYHGLSLLGMVNQYLGTAEFRSLDAAVGGVSDV